ncbi:TIGR03620 family F420-dependent LLM class oxidoreductase [Candidatus Solirubrobacter pratensis]|uniref:TIGR03620 family F420-dependent LLM class oxidoreductase n=1 Tax=Candidatus Solirubrobacter pratensis TaxID=1298857 RepID=UPI0004134672|nr:TIGR03620 family F420-dependent LLM class oxidoreductase [Candidatus Solirubrobacter pratensis]
MTDLGRLGVWWALLGSQDAATERDAAREIERLGYSTLWYGESMRNKDALAHAAILLDATERINVASGIASIYVRDPAATKSGAYFLADASGGRFVLGLGVSHAPAVKDRGHDYGKPVSTMRAYLDEMDEAEYQPPAPADPPPVLLAALRPRMLRLAAERTAGAHPYLTTPKHTARAREVLGERSGDERAARGRSPLLAPEQGFVIEPEPEKARAIAREHLKYYLVLPNYVNAWREDGFEDADFADGGSDRLVDALVAWGDADAVKARIREHHDAGADHVCIQPVTTDLERGLAELAELSNG